MSTEPAWRPEIVPGGGFDPRAMADQLWAAGNFEAANEIGRMVPDIDGRVCGLTGMQAHGYARIPGTNVSISHGGYEATPTPLQRWMGGWKDRQGTLRDPELPILKVSRRGDVLFIPLAAADKGAYRGGETLAGVLGLTDGALLEMDYTADGDILLRLHAAPKPGPTPVAD